MEKKLCEGTPMRAEVRLPNAVRVMSASGAVPGCGMEMTEVQYPKPGKAGIMGRGTLHVCPRCDSPESGATLPETLTWDGDDG